MRKVSTFSGVISIAIIAAAVGIFIYTKIEEADLGNIAIAQPVSTDKIKKDVEKEKVVCEKPEPCIELPVVRFIPGTFADKEKEDLMEKVINPFIDFENDSYVENDIISIAVNKYSENELAEMQDPKYMYNISAIYEEGYGGWLEREVGEDVEWWVPDCLDECDFSDEFKEKYPEIIEKYNEMQNQEE